MCNLRVLLCHIIVIKEYAKYTKYLREGHVETGAPCSKISRYKRVHTSIGTPPADKSVIMIIYYGSLSRPEIPATAVSDPATQSDEPGDPKLEQRYLYLAFEVKMKPMGWQHARHVYIHKEAGITRDGNI